MAHLPSDLGVCQPGVYSWLFLGCHGRLWFHGRGKAEARSQVLSAASLWVLFSNVSFCSHSGHLFFFNLLFFALILPELSAEA